jgi:hemerythrin superfamily protein
MPDFLSTGGTAEDALDVLKLDHDEVAALFARYQELVASDASSQARQELAEEICTMLTVHTAIEEEIFYPAVRDALDEEVEIDEALADHDRLKDVVAEIQGGDPADPEYDQRVGVLAELVAEHVQYEESEVFPAARESSMDLQDLGAQLSERQEMLLSADED